MFLAAGVAAPADKTSASISGLAGFSFESTMKNGKGELLQLKLTIVSETGERRHGSATMLEVRRQFARATALGGRKRHAKGVQIIGAGR